MYIEGIFGEGKERHLLRRMLFRGLKKAKIQVILTASVMNLKRLVKELGKRSSDILLLKYKLPVTVLGIFNLFYLTFRIANNTV